MIIGPRQVGKPTLAKALQQDIEGPSEYLDLELDSHLRRLDDAESYLRSEAQICVIIDEIQQKPKLSLDACPDRSAQTSRPVCDSWLCFS